MTNLKSECFNRCGRTRDGLSAYCPTCQNTNRDKATAAGRVTLPAGSAMAQCSNCQRIFTSVSGFDRHRRDGKCLDPARTGLVQRERSGFTAWGYPGDEEALARRRGSR